MTNLKKVKQGKETILYKGYGINYINGNYRAESYANESFYNTNLTKLKKDINNYLNA